MRFMFESRLTTYFSYIIEVEAKIYDSECYQHVLLYSN